MSCIDELLRRLFVGNSFYHDSHSQFTFSQCQTFLVYTKILNKTIIMAIRCVVSNILADSLGCFRGRVPEAKRI